MARSSKKGPFVDFSLEKKVQKAKETNDRKPIKTWSRASMITPDMVGIQLECITADNTFPFLLRKIWLARNWENFL